MVTAHHCVLAACALGGGAIITAGVLSFRGSGHEKSVVITSELTSLHILFLQRVRGENRRCQIDRPSGD